MMYDNYSVINWSVSKNMADIQQAMAGDLKRHRAHYGVNLMLVVYLVI